MRFEATAIPGAWIIHPEPIEDPRGHFARTYCKRAFAQQGIPPLEWVQCSLSHNRERGTLRGMHLQDAPHAEVKLVRCTAGAVYDVIVDLRPDSPAYLRYTGVELRANTGLQLLIPEGCAHGFLTLAPGTEVYYQMSAFYAPEAARGYRYNDPAFGIAWPEEVRVIADRDRDYPDYHPERNTAGNP